MKTKRTMAGILAMAMAASALAFNPVFAAGEIGISAEKVSAKAGAEFTLAVSLKDVPSTGVGGCEFSLAYDSSIVTVTGVTAGTIAQTGADDQESAFAGEAPSFDSNFSAAGVIDVIYSTGLTDSAYMVKQDGVFLTITGTVNESARLAMFLTLRFSRSIGKPLQVLAQRMIRSCSQALRKMEQFPAMIPLSAMVL